MVNARHEVSVEPVSRGWGNSREGLDDREGAGRLTLFTPHRHVCIPASSRLSLAIARIRLLSGPRGSPGKVERS